MLKIKAFWIKPRTSEVVARKGAETQRNDLL